ncbi:MAG: TonB-dependent receptor [Saprospiraceae bacterium]
MKIFQIFYLTIIVSGICVAQNQDSISDQFLEPVIYTANRFDQNPNEVGRSIKIITQEEIKKSNAISFSELISQEAGIFIVGAGQSPGQLSTIFSRGSNSNQTNILLDGVKISNPSSTDNLVDLSEFSLANIDHIEIIKGNHSSLFGSSSIGATINIITKKNSNLGIHGDVALKLGTIGKKTSLFEQVANLSYRHTSGLYASVGLFNSNIKGINATVDTITDKNNYYYQRADQDDFRKLDGFYKLGYIHSRWDVAAQLKTADQNTDLDRGAYRDDNNYKSKFQRKIIALQANYKLNNSISFELLSSYTKLFYQYVDDTSVIKNSEFTYQEYTSGNYKAQTYANELQFNMKKKYAHLILGLAQSYESMGFQSYYFSNGFVSFEYLTDLYKLNLSAQTISEFAQLNLYGNNIQKIPDNLNLSLSLRNTHHEQFGNQISYGINPSYKLRKNILLYADFSSGFVSPSLYQLYSPDMDFTSGITRGNPSLKPEESNSIELGIKYEWNNKFNSTLSFYRNQTKNNIDYVYLWSKDKEIANLDYTDYRGDSYINLGSRITQGIELDLNARINKKLSCKFNINIIKGEINYSNADIDSSHIKSNLAQLYSNGAFINKNQHQSGLTRRPSTANFVIEYAICSRLMLSGIFKYVASRNDIYYNNNLGPFGALASTGLDAYTLFDFNLRYRCMKNMNLYLRLENILDTKYSEINGYSTRGRSLYAQMSYKF